jgi:hypothetical protein
MPSARCEQDSSKDANKMPSARFEQDSSKAARKIIIYSFETLVLIGLYEINRITLCFQYAFN